MRKNWMKLLSLTLCFAVAAVMLAACGKTECTLDHCPNPAEHQHVFTYPHFVNGTVKASAGIGTTAGQLDLQEMKYSEANPTWTLKEGATAGGLDTKKAGEYANDGDQWDKVQAEVAAGKALNITFNRNYKVAKDVVFITGWKVSGGTLLRNIDGEAIYDVSKNIAVLADMKAKIALPGGTDDEPKLDKVIAATAGYQGYMGTYQGIVAGDNEQLGACDYTFFAKTAGKYHLEMNVINVTTGAVLYTIGYTVEVVA